VIRGLIKHDLLWLSNHIPQRIDIGHLLVGFKGHRHKLNV